MNLTERIWRAPKPLIAAAALLVVSSLVPAAAVLLLQQALSAVLRGESALSWGVALVALVVLHGMVQWARTLASKSLAWRVAAELRSELLKHWLELSPQQLPSPGARAAAVTTELDQVQLAVSAWVTLLRDPFSVLFLVGVAVYTAPWLGLAALAMTPIVVGISRWAALRLGDAMNAHREARSRLAESVERELAASTEWQQYRATAQAHSRLNEAVSHDQATRTRLDLERVVPTAATALATTSALVVLLALGGNEVAAGRLDAAQLVAFVAAVALTRKPLGALAEVPALFRAAEAALARVAHHLELERCPASPEHPVALPPGPLSLRWERVRQRFGEVEVIRGVSFGVEPGEKLALVGESGAGKSTLLRLAARHFDPTKGQLLLGGVRLENVALSELRARVIHVSQDPSLVEGTVADNLDPSGRLSRDELQSALVAAGAHTIRSLEDSVHDLSGGEKQRMALARALAQKPDLLLLDEPVQQLDAEHAAAMVSALQGLDGPTVVWVTHDLTLSAAADRVAMIEDGELTEQGSHDALLSANARYARWWALAAPA